MKKKYSNCWQRCKWTSKFWIKFLLDLNVGFYYNWLMLKSNRHNAARSTCADLMNFNFKLVKILDNFCHCDNRTKHSAWHEILLTLLVGRLSFPKCMHSLQQEIENHLNYITFLKNRLRVLFASNHLDDLWASQIRWVQIVELELENLKMSEPLASLLSPEPTCFRQLN